MAGGGSGDGEEPEFQIAPMIDVLLVLLVFFISISTTEILQTVKGITLAVAKDAKQPEPGKGAGQVIVNLQWDEAADRGKVIISEREYNVNEITDILQRAHEKDPTMRVLVRADRTTKYEFVRSTMVAVSRAQIPNITFSTVDKDDPNAAKK